jgi:hypothetical protein
VTVAIGALSGFPNDVLAIGAADHMITVGDIEFEQPQPKMWKLGNRAVAIFYGLSAAQGQIAHRTEAVVLERTISEVGQIADVYALYLREHIRREAETDILAPLGLSIKDLRRRPSTINQTLLNSLSKQMQMYYESSGLKDELGGAIIIGNDSTGCHIYQVEDGRSTLMDGVGFAAGGGGQWHAASQFMFSRYTRWWQFPKALSLLYAAKKRAEVAPGVGTETDLVIVIPGNDVIHHQFNSPFVQRLEQIYQEHWGRQEAGFEQQHKEVKAFIDELIKPAEPPQRVAATGEIPPIGTPAPPVGAKPKLARKSRKRDR